MFFPAWIAAYICMSAPLGRVVDRHIKLYRYRSHPIVIEGEHLKEPLLHLVASSKAGKSREAASRRRRSEQRRSGPRKQGNKEKSESKDSEDSKTVVAIGSDCPECGCDMVERDGPNTKICKICRHEWR